MGSVASGAMNWVSGIIEDKDSVEKLHSQLVKSLATQALAFTLVYLSKKAEEYLTKNHDIATEKGFRTQDVDFTDLNSDAGEHL